MRFLTDENIPSVLVKSIRAKGHSVRDIKEEGLAGSKDSIIMALSQKEERVIITLDKDFATYPLKKHHGVILLRYSNKRASNITEQFCYFLDSPLKQEIEKSLCEIFDNYVRIRKE